MIQKGWLQGEENILIYLSLDIHQQRKIQEKHVLKLKIKQKINILLKF